MTQLKDPMVRASFPTRCFRTEGSRTECRFPITAMAAIAAAVFASACSDDDINRVDGRLNTTGGSANGGSANGGSTRGSSANGGSGGSAGVGISASAGAADRGGSVIDTGNGPGSGSGSVSNAGRGGAADSDAGSTGATGTVTQLSADAALLFPTTAAFRGNDVLVVNGQLDEFQGTPSLPFTVLSIPLAGGAVNGSINLPGSDFFPEGIAAAADGTLFVGSVAQRTILRVPPNSTIPDATPFVAATVAERGVVGVEVDPRHALLWFCDSNPVGPGGTALVAVDLANGSEVVRHTVADPISSTPDAGTDAGVDAGDAGGDAGAASGPRAFCNDVVVQSSGNVFFTDSSGRIFRIPNASVRTPNSAQLWLQDPALAPATPGGFGANGLAFVGDRLIIANTELIAVDPDSSEPVSTIQRISLTEDGEPVTLCGPDGLETVPNSNTDLVVIENGSCAAARDRVIRVSLALDPPL